MQPAPQFTRRAARGWAAGLGAGPCGGSAGWDLPWAAHSLVFFTDWQFSQLNALDRFSDRTARLHAVTALWDVRSTAFVLGAAQQQSGAALPPPRSRRCAAGRPFQPCAAGSIQHAPEERPQQLSFTTRLAQLLIIHHLFVHPLSPVQRRYRQGSGSLPRALQHRTREPRAGRCLRSHPTFVSACGEQKAAVPPPPAAVDSRERPGPTLESCRRRLKRCTMVRSGPLRSGRATGERCPQPPTPQRAGAGPGHPRPQRSGSSIAGSPRGGRGAARPHRSAPALEAAPPTRPGPAPPAADCRQPAAGTRTRRFAAPPPRARPQERPRATQWPRAPQWVRPRDSADRGPAALSRNGGAAPDPGSGALRVRLRRIIAVWRCSAARGTRPEPLGVAGGRSPGPALPLTCYPLLHDNIWLYPRCSLWKLTYQVQFFQYNSNADTELHHERRRGGAPFIITFKWL